MKNLFKALDKAKANKKLILVKVYDEEYMCEGTSPDYYALNWEIGSDKLPEFPECKGEGYIEILYTDDGEYQLYYKDKDTTKINEGNITWLLNREEWGSVMNALLGVVLYHGQLPDEETWFKQYRQELTHLFFEVRKEIIKKNLSIKQIGEYLVRAEADMIGNSHLVNKCPIDQEQLLRIAGKIKSLVTGISPADIRLNPNGREKFIYLYAEDYEPAIWEQYCEDLNILKDEKEVRINFDKTDIVTGTQINNPYTAVYTDIDI